MEGQTGMALSVELANQWRNHAWAIVVNDQVALSTDQVALPLDLIKQFLLL